MSSGTSFPGLFFVAHRFGQQQDHGGLVAVSPTKDPGEVPCLRPIPARGADLVPYQEDLRAFPQIGGDGLNLVLGLKRLFGEQGSHGGLDAAIKCVHVYPSMAPSVERGQCVLPRRKAPELTLA